MLSLTMDWSMPLHVVLFGRCVVRSRTGKILSFFQVRLESYFMPAEQIS